MYNVKVIVIGEGLPIIAASPISLTLASSLIHGLGDVRYDKGDGASGTIRTSNDGILTFEIIGESKAQE